MVEISRKLLIPRLGFVVTSISGDYNTTITFPEDPEKVGYEFGGWYVDEEGTTEEGAEGAEGDTPAEDSQE